MLVVMDMCEQIVEIVPGAEPVMDCAGQAD
jgi:hypothetical protein